MAGCALFSRRLLLSVVLAFGILHQGAEGNKQCREKVADIVFLLDSSYSIWQDQFTGQQLSFLIDLVDSFTIGPNNIRVGVVTFSTNVRLDVALNEYSSKRELQDAIGRIQYMKGGTRTGDAIHFAHSKMFTTDYGSRPWAAHIVILITDGYSYNSSQTTMEASVARSHGIQMFAIGVGGGVDETELRAIASDPDDSHVFHVENYGALKEIEKALAKEACHRSNTNQTSPDDSEEPDSSEDTASKRCGGKPADVYFLLDSSSSIWSVHFGEEIQFVSRLVQLFDLGADRTRVAAAVYSDHVKSVLTFSDPQNQQSVRKVLKTAPYLTGSTNTGKALHFVRTNGFADARREVAHVIIVLTDGQSSNTTHTLQEARAAHKQGMYVFSVGIGSMTDVQELMEIASDPDENFMFHVDNFTGLQAIRELLAIKTCDVEVPDYQGDQPSSECRVTKPTDILFVYDSASVNRVESDVIANVIRTMVENMDPDPDTVRFGLIRENCYKGDNVDLKTGAEASVLRALLQKSHHHGLHALLKRVRLHGYLETYDDTRPRSRKVIVLFVGSKMADPAAVEKEMMRLKFQGVRLLIVAVGSGRENMDLLTKVATVPPLFIDSHNTLRHSRQQIHQKFCEINKMKD